MKKILLSLVLCGLICNPAIAAQKVVRTDAAEKTTLIDADSLAIKDSESSNIPGWTTLTNFKTWLVTWFSTLDAVFGTIDTGQGANELFDMDQNVLTSSGPTFATLTITDDSNNRGTEAQTQQTFSDGDATPDITNGGSRIVRVWQTGNTSGTTITDFDDGDDHSEFAENDWFLLRVDDADTIIDFSANVNIEGNGGVDFTGSATQIVYLHFIFNDSRWNLYGLSGQSSPTGIAVSSIDMRGGTFYSDIRTVTDADGFTMTADQGAVGSVVYATGAGTIVMPPVVAGMQFTVECHAAAAVVLNPDASGTEDTIRLDGVALAQGDSTTSGSAAGDVAVCTYYAADTWSCITNGWTDTN
jgi:hypothetical protein